MTLRHRAFKLGFIRIAFTHRFRAVLPPHISPETGWCVTDIHKVGIPDLIVAQHAMPHNLSLFSLDKHFRLLSKHMALTLH